MTVLYDDVYFARTRARVELGNNNVYGNCTHREIQPITNWSDGSITASLNTGSFTNNETLYLFVVDKNGNVSNGVDIEQIANPEDPPPEPVLIKNTSFIRSCLVK